MLPRSLATCCQFEAEGETWLIGSRAAARSLGASDSLASQHPHRRRRVLDRLLSSPEGRRLALALLSTRGLELRPELRPRIERALDRGELLLWTDARVQPRADALPHVAARPEPPIRPQLDDDFELSDKSLLITACPPEIQPRRGSIAITYLLRELAGQPITLTLRSAAYPGEVLVEHPLAPAETRDGSHDFVWNGTLELGPRQGELVTPALSPICVEIRRDDTYKDDATFVVVPPTVEVLALGDLNFSTGREVMLPAPSVEAEQDADLADGIALVAGLLAHLRSLGEDRRVLVAGHTDAAGSERANLDLSQRRAENVRLYIAGDSEGWAAHAHEHAEVGDGQELLRWVASRFGWPCDPGSIDGDEGPRTRAGRDAFRARYEHELGESAGSGDGFRLADWRAFFAMYELDLAARLGLTTDQLPRLRESIVACEPATLGCGEHWPNEPIPRPRVCRDDRRVELLVFHPDELPEPIGGDQPPGKSIYEPGAYRWLPINPGPAPHPLEGPCFELGIALDDPALLPAQAQLRLYGGPYDLRLKVGEATHAAGILQFHFHGIATGVRYAIDYEPPEGEPLTLARELDLDPLIATLDDGGDGGDEQLRVTGFMLALPVHEVIDEGSFDVEVW
jgi:hypothetical protein